MRKPVIYTRTLLMSAVAAALMSTNLVAGGGGYSGGESGIAAQEIIKRQQRVSAAREAEADGDRLAADGDFEGAIAKYQEALLGAPDAPMTRADRTRIIAKYSRASIKQADKLGKQGAFDQAKQLLNTILQDDIDPGNATAKTLLKRLDDPDYYNPSMTTKHSENVEKVRMHFKKALGYYDLGQFDEAQAELNRVLAIDNTNVAARRLLEDTEREITNYLRAARDHTRAAMLRAVDAQWETAVPSASLIPPTPKGSLQPASPILFKLKNIKLENVNLDQTSIDDAVSFLRTKSVELDPTDKTGVNFILQSDGKAAPITLQMKNVPMITAVEQICALAGMKYKVESHAVVIYSPGKSGGTLETRVFRVPPNFLSLGGGGGGAEAPADADPFAAGGGASSAAALPARPSAQQVLISLGANFDAPGSNATFLAGSSRLIVKNTLQQLDFIEGVVEQLFKDQGVTKQVYITTKFVEVSQRNHEELGFDWLIGAFNIGGNRTFASGGTASNSGQINATDYPFLLPTGGTNPVPIGQNPVTRGLRFGTNAITQNAIDGLLARQLVTADISTLSPGIFALAGVFTDPQFQMVVRALSQHKGVDLLTAPSIVTRSGQRAKIEVIREFPYPVDFDPPTIPQDFGTGGAFGGGFGAPGGGIIGGGGGLGTAAANSFPVTPTTPNSFEFRNTGVTMEVDPVIGEDGFTIDLNVAPEVTEFEGFINYGSPINAGAVNAAGVPTTIVLTENRIEQPVFATRKLTTAVTIWDGQTVGIGGLIREDVQAVEDKVPLLGDLPLIGRLFRTQSEEHFKKNLMIYVTAKLIDPSGNTVAPATDNEDAEGSADTSSDGSLLPPPPLDTTAPELPTDPAVTP